VDFWSAPCQPICGPTPPSDGIGDGPRYVSKKGVGGGGMELVRSCGKGTKYERNNNYYFLRTKNICAL
jgi:hypothetical protein